MVMTIATVMTMVTIAAMTTIAIMVIAVNKRIVMIQVMIFRNNLIMTVINLHRRMHRAIPTLDADISSRNDVEMRSIAGRGIMGIIE